MIEQKGFVFHCREKDSARGIGIFGPAEGGNLYSLIGGKGLNLFKTPEESAELAYQFWIKNNQPPGEPRIARVKLRIEEPKEKGRWKISNNLIVLHPIRDGMIRLLGPVTNKKNLDYCNGVGQELFYNGITAFNRRNGETAYDQAEYARQQITRQAGGEEALLSEFLLENLPESRMLFQEASQAKA
jgi:hypothetical protein